MKGIYIYVNIPSVTHTHARDAELKILPTVETEKREINNKSRQKPFLL